MDLEYVLEDLLLMKATHLAMFMVVLSAVTGFFGYGEILAQLPSALEGFTYLGAGIGSVLELAEFAGLYEHEH